MENYKSFDFLSKISFERLGGSEQELKAANMIIAECHKMGVEAHLEDFLVDGYSVKAASLEANGVSYEVTGVGMSGSTPADGVVGKLLVLENDDQLNQYETLEDYVVFVPSRIAVKTYKILCEKKALAFICASGSVYDDRANSDLEKMTVRERHYSNGKVPGVCVRMMDAQKMLLDNPETVHVVCLQDEYKNTSHNVVASIPGDGSTNEIVCFTAHYDSVAFSTGAYDNGTGSTTILQSLAYFIEHKPKRNLKFIWCGSEEMGLLGAKAYCEAHADDLKNHKLCINVDMTGVVLGRDIACCTSKDSLVSYINYMGKEVGFNISAKQGVYSSDSTPFADKGVPSLSFARLAPRGGAEIHSRKDVIDFLDSENYYKTCEFINMFADRMVNSKVFPVEQIIPDNMKNEIDIYFGRKERN